MRPEHIDTNRRKDEICSLLCLEKKPLSEFSVLPDSLGLYKEAGIPRHARYERSGLYCNGFSLLSSY